MGWSWRTEARAPSATKGGTARMQGGLTCGRAKREGEQAAGGIEGLRRGQEMEMEASRKSNLL